MYADFPPSATHPLSHPFGTTYIHAFLESVACIVRCSCSGLIRFIILQRALD